MIQAIETVYNGYRFRSRLEARWAVFFDTLGIRYEYEAQDYVIDGRRYLPDFKLILPTDEIVFAEVKNAEVDDHVGEHVDLCRGLSRLTNCRVLLLVGIPAYRMYNQFTPQLPSDGFTAAFFKDYDEMIETADDYWFQKIDLNEDTGALEFRGDEHRMYKAFGQGLLDAVKAAQQARFEFGEHGTPRVAPPPPPPAARPLIPRWQLMNAAPKPEDK